MERIREKFAFIFVFVLLGTGTSHAAPLPLVTFHGQCVSESMAQTGECVAAMHRACSSIGHSAGISQEAGRNVLGVACFNTPFYGDISFSELSARHGDCNNGSKGQSMACFAAVHRACSARGFNAGLVQEVGVGVFGVACLSAGLYVNIGFPELRARHSGCQSAENAVNGSCFAAMHRACVARGYGAGIPQELSTSEIGVACFQPEFYGDINVL